jgi:hypothetical protein
MSDSADKEEMRRDKEAEKMIGQFSLRGELMR